MIRWEADGYEVAFTTRVGGVSEGPYASLNLGRKSGDDVERVDENRRIACEAIGADLERLALNYQVHSRPRAAGGAGDARRARGRACGPTSPACRSSRCPPTACRSCSRARARTSRPSPSSTPAGRGCSPASSRRASHALGSGTLAAAIGPGSARAATRWGRRSRRRSASASATTSCAGAASTSGRAPSARFAPPASSGSTASTAARPASPRRSSRTAATRAAPGRQGVIAYVAG